MQEYTHKCFSVGNLALLFILELKHGGFPRKQVNP